MSRIGWTTLQWHSACTRPALYAQEACTRPAHGRQSAGSATTLIGVALCTGTGTPGRHP
jgi:hypothetical protein